MTNFSITCEDKVDLKHTLKYLVDAFGCCIRGYYVTRYKGDSNIQPCNCLVFTSDDTCEFSLGIVPSNSIVMTEIVDHWLKSLNWSKTWKKCEIFRGDESNLDSVHGKLCICIRLLKWEDIK